MKSFSVIAFFVAIFAEDQPSLNRSAVSLEAAYGHLEPVKSLLPWSARAPSPSRFSSYKLRTRSRCTFPLDVVIVQDATASFADDFAVMRDTQLQAMFRSLRRDHPGSRYGVISFRDKPIGELGRSTDYCERIELTLTNDTKAVEDVYARLVSTGGGDFPENQFGAIVAAALSEGLGWSPRDSIATRLIVLATDAPPHYSDDAYNLYGMLPFTGLYKEASSEQQCVEEYYPSPDHVKQALWARQAYLAQLVFDSVGQNGIVGRSWNWFNTYIGQTEEFVEPMLDNASNFWEALAGVIEQIEDVECGAMSSTSTARTPLTGTTLTASGTTDPRASDVTLSAETLSTRTLSEMSNSAQLTTRRPTSGSTTAQVTESALEPSRTTNASTSGKGSDQATSPTETSREAISSFATNASATGEVATSAAMKSTLSESTLNTNWSVSSSRDESSGPKVSTDARTPELSANSSTALSTAPECPDKACKDELVIRFHKRPVRLQMEVESNNTSL